MSPKATFRGRPTTNRELLKMEGSFLGTQVYLTESSHRKHARLVLTSSIGLLVGVRQNLTSYTKQTNKKKLRHVFNQRVCKMLRLFTPSTYPLSTQKIGIKAVKVPLPLTQESTAQSEQTLGAAAHLGQTLLDLHCLPRSQLSSGTSCVRPH